MERQAFYRYVMTFTRTTDTMETAKAAGALFPNANVIPVPNQISKSCGLAIEFPTWEPVAQRRFFDSLAVPAHLFRLTLAAGGSGAYRILDAREMPGRKQQNRPCVRPVDIQKRENSYGNSQQV